jgi:glycosyltransferase involved in cell wall biosynthesis
MKILSVAGWIYPDQEGGSFRLVHEVARRMAARGHAVHVVTRRIAEQHPLDEVIEGFHVHRFASRAPTGLGLYLSTLRQVPPLLRRLQAEVGFDALHLHHPIASLAANRTRAIRHLPRALMLYVPYVLEYRDRHTYDPRTGEERPLALRRRLCARLLKTIDGYNLRRSDRVVVLSEFSRRLIGEFYPNCLGKVVKLPGGADLDRFRPEPSRAEARARLGLTGLGLPDGPALFFTCRRLEHRMGLLELIQAIQGLRREGRGVHLLIAGRGALADDLQRHIRERSLRDSVRLLGFVAEADLPLYYRAADCFVLPTRALEGFGLVTAEAFACGTPVVGTPAGATPEVIRPFDPRLVADDASADGIRRALARFLDEVAPDEHLAARCRAYAEQHLSWDTLTDGLLRLFEELRQQGGRR